MPENKALKLTDGLCLVKPPFVLGRACLEGVFDQLHQNVKSPYRLVCKTSVHDFEPYLHQSH